MNPDVQWCAFKAVESGILTPELCKQIGDMFPDGCDIQLFAQTILDNHLCTDLDVVQGLMNEAFALGQSDELPPVNYFDDAPPPEPKRGSGLKLASKPPSTAAPADHPAHATGDDYGAMVGAASGDVPSIHNVESMADDEVRNVMVGFLMAMRKLGASDFHLSADFYPFARIKMEFQTFGDLKLSAAASERLNTILLTTEQKEEFLKHGDLDICLALDPQNRFRVNLMKHKDGQAGTYRLIPNRIQTLEELGFKNTETIYKLLDYNNGLILVAGAVGAGKTTTLAALIDTINHKRHDHVITVEEPIEIVQFSDHCNVTQREVGIHTKSFASALKGALREDPDIIVIGELRDLETIEMAITASETGHLVIGTLHTSDAGSTLSRLLDVFPPSQQQQIRAMVAESLKGIICQQLIPKVGGGMAVALEILINNTAVAKNIRENTAHQIRAVLETGMKLGMCTMEGSIVELFEKGLISEEHALSRLTDKGKISQVKNKSSGAQPPPDTESKKKRFGFR